MLAGSVGFLLSKLGFLTASRFAEALRPLQLNPGHFALLRIVDASGPRSQQALGESLGIPPSRMVALVDELERPGLLERRRSEHDRRVNQVALTTEGRRVLKKASAIANAWEDDLCAGLAPGERDQLRELLVKLAARHELPVGVHPGLAR